MTIENVQRAVVTSAISTDKTDKTDKRVSR